jgi:hypothetical protein
MFVFCRCCGERTVELFRRNNIARLGNVSTIDISHEPFCRTVEEMLRLALDLPGPFLALDADVFVVDASPIWDNAHRHYCNFRVRDKFRRIVEAGVHLFSKPMIEAMWRVFETVDRQNTLFVTRPEGFVTLKALAQTHHKVVVARTAIGLHDFSQFRRDIFHKYVYRGWRDDRRYYLRKVFAEWHTFSDVDYRVAESAIRWAWQARVRELSRTDGHRLFQEFDFDEKPEDISESELRDMKVAAERI